MRRRAPTTAAASRICARRWPRPSPSATARALRARAPRSSSWRAELGRAVGLGGRVRRAGGAAERARSAVQRRIKNALERIGEHAPALAASSADGKTGNVCIFRPLRLSPPEGAPVPAGERSGPSDVTRPW